MKMILNNKDSTTVMLTAHGLKSEPEYLPVLKAFMENITAPLELKLSIIHESETTKVTVVIPTDSIEDGQGVTLDGSALINGFARWFGISPGGIALSARITQV